MIKVKCAKCDRSIQVGQHDVKVMNLCAECNRSDTKASDIWDKVPDSLKEVFGGFSE